jgi:AcrR family transcriptional regulator
MPPRPKRADGRRRRPRQERSRALVDAIVQATVELAAERGLEHVSTDHIAARAGVSVGSVYQYFASKDVAVREAIEARARAGNQAMVAQLATIGSLPLEEAIAGVRFSAVAPTRRPTPSCSAAWSEHAAVREELDRAIFAATALLSCTARAWWARSGPGGHDGRLHLRGRGRVAVARGAGADGRSSASWSRCAWRSSPTRVSSAGAGRSA